MANKPIDIVYPLGEGLSNFRNQEIMFSLRSVEKHLTGYRNIFIIGFKPTFLNEKIIHIPHKDNPYFNKERRIMEKFKKACSIPEISDKFLMFNDDYFFTKPLNVQKIPYYNKGTLDGSVKKRKTGSVYRHSLENTYNALKEKGYGTKHFDIHYPMYYDKKKFPEVMAMYDWENARNGFVIKSLYANTLKIKGVYRHDCKIMGLVTKKEEVIKQIKDYDMFSTSEITRAIIGILREMYPDKSIYEV